MKIFDTRKNTLLRARAFFSDLKKDDTIYIIGSNKYGLSLANYIILNGYDFGGFVNDFTDYIEYSGYPIIKSKAINQNDSIINCVVEGRTIDVNEHIVSLNIRASCDYFALQLAYPNDLPQLDFLEGTSTILERQAEYSDIYNLLYDEQSKLEFESLTNFRLNRDIHYMADFKFRLNEQYFEEFTNLNKIYSFIDGGSYDGATTLEFIKRQPGYNKIFVFEPSSSSYTMLKKEFNKFKNVLLFNKGLWDSAKTLYFNSALGSASKIDEDGVEKIETTTIDSIISDKIDFIKLDIEGAEKQALDGAKESILKFKPVLAICVYHSQNDFIDIPKKILKLNPEYKIYLRHYTQGIFETVMYFIP